MNSEWFDEGYSAYFSDLDHYDNPYEVDTHEHDEWSDGWHSAEFDD